MCAGINSARTYTFALGDTDMEENKAVIESSREAVRCWYEAWDGAVYVAFSGGKDSTALLHLVRELYPDVPAVFNNTGLEFPEIVEFVRTFDNVVELRPKMPFHKVIERFGWPVISKEQPQFIYEYRTSNSKKLRELRWNGRDNGRSKISEKWKFAVDAPFKISHHCCNKLKKQPAKAFEKRSGLHPILGTMASEGALRHQLKGECNAYHQRRPVSKPITNWSEGLVWEYLRHYDVPYCDIYNMGYERTGCVFCMYGAYAHEVTRFEQMRKTHPKLYAYCMDKLGAREVMNFFGWRH